MPLRKGNNRGQRRKHFTVDLWHAWHKAREENVHTPILREGIKTFRRLIDSRGKDTHGKNNGRTNNGKESNI